jgi:hypothetical protein
VPRPATPTVRCKRKPAETGHLGLLALMQRITKGPGRLEAR